MSKTTKPERRAIAALEDATAAAKFAKQVAKTLDGKQGKKLRAAADEAKSAADVSKKAIRRRPKKVAKRAEKAADIALAATETALSREQKKAAAKAEKAAAKVTKGVRKKDAAKKDASHEPAESVSAFGPAADEHSLEPAETTPTDLDTLTVAALRDRARDEGRTGYSRLTKAQLVELLS